MDLSKYITLFLQEMRDNLAQLNRHLVELEKDAGNIPLLQEIMRLSHSGKGSSAAMGFSSTADLFHALEDVFDAARKGKIRITRDITTLCLHALDQVEASFNTIEQTKAEADCSSWASDAPGSSLRPWAPRSRGGPGPWPPSWPRRSAP